MGADTQLNLLDGMVGATAPPLSPEYPPDPEEHQEERIQVPEARDRVEGPVTSLWKELPGDLLQQLAQVPCRREMPPGWDHPLVHWYTTDGRFLRAVQRRRKDDGAVFWDIDDEGQLDRWGGSMGYLASCMSQSRVVKIMRDLIAEHRAAMQTTLL